MGELHEYRLSYVDRHTKATAAACVSAYSAEDALTQWRVANPVDTGAGPVFKIEPLPAAPVVPDERAEALRERAEERDRLRSERDALAIAALGTEAPSGFQVFKGDVGAVLDEIRGLRARSKNRLEALDQIADLVWPGHTRPFFYALAPLVEAVRKLRDQAGHASGQHEGEEPGETTTTAATEPTWTERTGHSGRFA